MGVMSPEENVLLNILQHNKAIWGVLKTAKKLSDVPLILLKTFLESALSKRVGFCVLSTSVGRNGFLELNSTQLESKLIVDIFNSTQLKSIVEIFESTQLK